MQNVDPKLPHVTQVLIVDDDPLALSALTRYFSKAPDFRVVATASSGMGALHALDDFDVDLILSDIHMPQMNGVELLERIKQREKVPVFIAITAIDNDQSMLRVLGKGGSGYILKSQTPSSIIQAARDAVLGGMVVSPSSVEQLVASVSEPPRPSSEATLLERVIHYESELSTMEKRALELLCQGLSNAEIASALQYSESSVKRFVSQLMQRFSAGSRLELVVMMLNKPL